MPKLFVISDVHSHYDAMKTALDNAGFNPDDENHWLISCGDELDRHDQPREVIKYLKNLPRKILIRGNHTDLIEKCCDRGYPLIHDYSNGTFDTIRYIGREDLGRSFGECCVITDHFLKDYNAEMVNYFETKNYIFVHSFIALKCLDDMPPYYTRGRVFEFDPDWRTAHASAWESARWGNPYELAAKGFLPDKTLVFGHFHTSWPRAKYYGESEFGPSADFSPFYGKGYIAIDACTAYSGKVNVLVLEDEFI